MIRSKLAVLLVSFICLVSCASGNRGDELFDQQKFDEAIDFYTDQLNNDSNDLEIHYNRGRAYEELGQLDKAILDYEFILEKDERHLNARLSLAQVYYKQGEYSKSVVLSSGALKFHQSSYNAHFMLARAKHHMGYTKAALKGYNAAIALKSDYGDAYLYRGALKSLMKITTACEDFRMARNLNVDGAEEALNKYCN